jgi:hypothetical protein
MYCIQCGTNNDDRAMHCKQCGAWMSQPGATPSPGPYTPAVPVGSGPKVPNYMVQSVLMTLFCCQVLGIISIFKATKVNKLLAANDYAGALAASKANKTLLWVGFAVGLVCYVILFIAGAIQAILEKQPQ